MNFPHSFSEQELAWMQASSVLVAVIALLFSALAVYFTARTYWQKKGAFVRGQYGIISSSVHTEHKYVCNVVLENLKDRSIVVFGIYLRLARNVFLEIERFDEEPLILKSFEATTRRYDPLDSYSFNMRRFNVNHLFNDRYKGVRLVLATSEGKVVIKKPILIWDPSHQWFRNHSIITMRPNRATFEGKGYGGNVLYVVHLRKGEEILQTFSLYPGEHTYKWFSDLGGTEDTLESAEKVKIVFEKAIAESGMKADRVTVIDAREALEKAYKDYAEEKTLDLRTSWFFVHVLARFATFWSRRKLRKENQARMHKSQ